MTLFFVAFRNRPLTTTSAFKFPRRPAPMDVFTPAMAHELALLVHALVALIKAIWPNGLRQ
jgi:hypothetical protein